MQNKKIDKAIKFIEEEFEREAFHHYLDNEELIVLLEILKGDSNE